MQIALYPSTVLFRSRESLVLKLHCSGLPHLYTHGPTLLPTAAGQVTPSGGKRWLRLAPQTLPLHSPPQQGLPLSEGEEPCPSSTCFLSPSASPTLSASSETYSLYSNILSLDRRSQENLHLCQFIRSNLLPQFCRSAILAFLSLPLHPQNVCFLLEGVPSFTAHWIYPVPNLPTHPSLVPISLHQNFSVLSDTLPVAKASFGVGMILYPLVFSKL